MEVVKSPAIEEGKIGITDNAACPGFIETEAVKPQAPEMTERIKKGRPLNRFGQPEEFGWMVVLLASEALSFISAAAVPVTGGLSC